MLCLLAPEPELRDCMADPAEWLSTSEQARLLGFGTPARRQTFLAGRWLARRALQRWRGSDASLLLEVAESGACRVAGAGDVFVSISHSAGVVACAVAASPVGVDVEDTTRPRDHLALAETVHSAAQREQLAALPPPARAVAFARWWTAKEAWLKARERGLDFAVMRGLAFEFDDSGMGGDVAVAELGKLMLAVAMDPALPETLDGPPGASWRRFRTRGGA